MELREALSRIEAIHTQMARTEVYRGYRAAPVAISGALAFSAAAFQSIWIPDPLGDVPRYLTLWVGVAIISAIGAGFGMVMRARHSLGTACPARANRHAIEQFAPAVVAGAMLTVIVVRAVPVAVTLLPGAWAILFSLGIFASRPFLPRAITGVAVFYLLAGLACLAWSQGSLALSPWAMGTPFGVGQFMAAAILHGTLERADAP